jgi:ATP-binding protein involved in chromosome partitioning
MKSYAEISGDGGSDILGQVVAQRERLAARMADVNHIIAIISGKGGVGKSALTANLAATLADQGWRVGALDVDLNGSTLVRMLGAKGQSLCFRSDGVEPAVGAAGVKVMSLDLFLTVDETPVIWQHPGGLAEDAFVWQGTMETTAVREFLADTLWGELDFLLIDLPPGTERFATLARLVPKTVGLSVTIPSAVSHQIVRRSVRAAQEANSKLLGLVENMAGYVCPSCYEIEPLFSQEPGGEVLADSLGLPFLGSVPFDSRLTRACDEGLPFVLSYPDAPTAHALRGVTEGLVRELCDEIPVRSL